MYLLCFKNIANSNVNLAFIVLIISSFNYIKKSSFLYMSLLFLFIGERSEIIFCPFFYKVILLFINIKSK